MDMVKALTLHHKLSNRRLASSQRQSQVVRAYLKKAFNDPSGVAQLDLIIRLQFLEGVAGVPVGKWWKKSGTQGLKDAIKHFEGDEIHQDWLSPRPSGMFSLLRNTAGKLLRGAPAVRNTEPDDLMQDLVMAAFKGKGPLRGAGERTSVDTIKRRDPMSMAKVVGSFLQNWIKNLIRDETSHSRKLQDRGVEDPDSWIHNPSGKINVIEEVLLNPNDSLGRKIRDLMRKTWAGNAVMEAFVDFWETRGRMPSAKDLAEVILLQEQGKGPEGAVSLKKEDLHKVQKRVYDHWKRMMPKFDKAWRSNKKLKAEMEARFLSRGVSPEYSDPSYLFSNPDPKMFGRFPGWKGKTAKRIASRWIEAQGYSIQASSGRELRSLVVGHASKALRSPWKVSLTKAQTKETVVGVDSEFWFSVESPPQRGFSLSPSAQINPSFQFFVTELTKGPKAGIFILQSLIVYTSPSKLDRMREFRSAKEVAKWIAKLISDHGYEQLTY